MINNTLISIEEKRTKDNYEVMIHSSKEITGIDRRTKYEKHEKKDKQST